MRNKTFVTAVFASFAWNLYLVGGVMLGASYALDRAAGGPLGECLAISGFTLN